MWEELGSLVRNPHRTDRDRYRAELRYQRGWCVYDAQRAQVVHITGRGRLAQAEAEALATDLNREGVPR